MKVQKIKKKYILMAAFLISGLALVNIVWAAAAAPAPGSDGDPLVTQGYVDQKIKNLSKSVSELTATVNDQASQITSLKKTADKLDKKLAKAVFKAVKITAGKNLLAGEGTEIVVISGKAKAIASKSGGIANLTTGKSLKRNAAIAANHLLLSAVEDGRGIKAVTETSVLVKGSYSIK